MNEILIQDSLKMANQVISQTTESENPSDWWMFIAMAELGIIAFLLLKNKFSKSQTKKQNFKEESLKQEIDFNNIINSSFHSSTLYDELKVKCHPDRFPTDEEKNSIAEMLFQEISKNQTNVKKLLELKEIAKQKLNIKF